MKNKKGFTLIELLAVIVILAILVLLAMPAVTSIMESSGRNTFKNEILGVVKTMENAYTEKWGNGDIVSTFDDDSKIHTVTKDDKTYSYLCMSLKQLYEEQYIKKNLGDNYGGYIQMYVGDTDTYTYINTTNGTYYMQGEYDALSASTYEPTKENNGNAVTKSTTCPSDKDNLDTPGTGGSTGAAPEAEWIDGEKTSDSHVKYAVSLWGIKKDTIKDGSEEKIAGLTFGPAMGDIYISSTSYTYQGKQAVGFHSHTPSGKTSKGNAKRCIHDDAWNQIIYWSKVDPEVYEDCIAEGCTKAVPMSEIEDILYSSNKSTNGDGSLLDYNLNNDYTFWDCYNHTKYGWSGSRIRAVLNGADENTKAEVAEFSGEEGSITGITEASSIFSAFPEKLRNAIRPKKIIGDKDGEATPESTMTTYDKLWLFSTYEVGLGGENINDEEVGSFDVTFTNSGHNGTTYSEKLAAMGITDPSVGNSNNMEKRRLYSDKTTYDSYYNRYETHNAYWFLRSPETSIDNSYETVNVWGVGQYGGADLQEPSVSAGIAPGFCIE